MNGTREKERPQVQEAFAEEQGFCILLLPRYKIGQKSRVGGKKPVIVWLNCAFQSATITFTPLSSIAFIIRGDTPSSVII